MHAFQAAHVLSWGHSLKSAICVPDYSQVKSLWKYRLDEEEEGRGADGPGCLCHRVWVVGSSSSELWTPYWAGGFEL